MLGDDDMMNLRGTKIIVHFFTLASKILHCRVTGILFPGWQIYSHISLSFITTFSLKLRIVWNCMLQYLLLTQLMKQVLVIYLYYCCITMISLPLFQTGRGGPLMCGGKLAAILSYGDISCKGCYPGVFTKLSYNKLKRWLGDLGIHFKKKWS